jgi:sulfoxide reductase heme-binding subunit YedZ
MIDRSVPYAPFEVVVPFSGPYRPIWVGMGQLSLAIGLLVFLSFYARKRIGQKRWRSFHYLSFVAFLGATAHGLMAGTDTASSRIVVAYAVALAVVTFLLAYRIVLAAAARHGQSRPSQGPVDRTTAKA